MISLRHLPRRSPLFEMACKTISTQHYLHSVPDTRTSFEVYLVEYCDSTLPAGFLIFGRPEATKCKDWYGSVPDKASNKCQVTRWQVLNLSRVWINPSFQSGGKFFHPDYLPGFIDRKGCFRSKLASEILKTAIGVIGFDYLKHRPPCFLEEPYEIMWLLSYCNTRLHKGAIYNAAQFEHYSTNKRGIQTWRIPLPELSTEQREEIKAIAGINKRSQFYRSKRAQLDLGI